MKDGSREPLPLRDAFATPDAKRRYTRRLFRTIADRYDLITRLLSFGRDQSWKRILVERCARVEPGEKALDLACGTGDIAFRLARRGAAVVGLDFTPRMIELARVRPDATPVAWVAGDMGCLPVASGRFDLVTAGYGLRNVPDLPAALDEIFRVLEPGGRLCALDFDRPDNRIVRGIYLSYLKVVGGTLGTLLHGDPDTYRYIPASIARYPGARGVAALMRRAGFEAVEVRPLLGGFIAIHVARKPSAPVS